MIIANYGPKQIQLKNGLLLISDDDEYNLQELKGDDDHKNFISGRTF